jgi:N-acetylmuramic acid 6-phosphate etherase
MLYDAPTEAASDRYRDLDAWPSGEVLDALWEAQAAATASVRSALPRIEAACAAAVPRIARGGRLGYAGAGTSARIAALDGSELPPTFGFDQNRIVLLIAGGDAALRASVEDAEDDADSARAAVAARGFGADDVLLGIAASGRTPFTVAAVVAARQRGAMTVGVASVAASPLLEAADWPIHVDTGAEPIAGSTRLKAGTAQKVVLNLFSTLLMLRLGHVHDGLMVDLQPRNEKLRRRAVAMVVRIAGCDEARARHALDASGGHVKRAALMLRHGIDAAAAARMLAEHAGHLRAALAASPP